MVVLDRLSQSRNSRFAYYLKGLARYLYPKGLLQLDFAKLESQMQQYDEAALYDRLNYYNQNTRAFTLGPEAKRLQDIPLKGSGSMYYLDLMEYARFFPQDAKLSYLFYDVTHVPDTPALTKSRPVARPDLDNTPSVLYKFCKVRNFKFVDDTIPFREKKDKLIWRGAANQPHRIAFMAQFFGQSGRIDIGHYSKRGDRHPQWKVPFMPIDEQLQHKFVFSIEGNDVATNVKWGMSSNSLLIMAKPKYETWFMEGRLIPSVHYVQVRDDYADLEEKIDYYLANPDEAEAIIHTANQYIAQFKDPKVEDWLSLKVLERYFQHSNPAA